MLKRSSKGRAVPVRVWAARVACALFPSALLACAVPVSVNPVPAGGKGETVADLGAGWPRASVEEVGLSSRAVAAAEEYARSVGSHCLLVVKDGKLVSEWYRSEPHPWSPVRPGPDVPVQTWSVSKSIAALLVGLAVQDGHIASLDDPVSRYVLTWQGTEKESITVRQLLSMTSGLGLDRVGMNRVSDLLWLELANDHSQSAVDHLVLSDTPGTRWRYANAPAQVLDSLLAYATGMDMVDYARERLFGPLGMSPTTDWARDSASRPTVFANVTATCPDLARIGQLMLQRGAWTDSQLLDANFVDGATRPSQELNPGYGLMWWLNGQDPTITSTNEPYGEIFPFAPDDLFFAKGAGNNFIDVIPSMGMVIVHVRPSPNEHPEFLSWSDATGLFEVSAWAVGELKKAGRNVQHQQILCRLLDPTQATCPPDEPAAAVPQ